MATVIARGVYSRGVHYRDNSTCTKRPGVTVCLLVRVAQAVTLSGCNTIRDTMRGLPTVCLSVAAAGGAVRAHAVHSQRDLEEVRRTRPVHSVSTDVINKNIWKNLLECPGAGPCFVTLRAAGIGRRGCAPHAHWSPTVREESETRPALLREGSDLVSLQLGGRMQENLKYEL